MPPSWWKTRVSGSRKEPDSKRGAALDSTERLPPAVVDLAAPEDGSQPMPEQPCDDTDRREPPEQDLQQHAAAARVEIGVHRLLEGNNVGEDRYQNRHHLLESHFLQPPSHLNRNVTPASTHPLRVPLECLRELQRPSSATAAERPLGREASGPCPRPVALPLQLAQEGVRRAGPHARPRVPRKKKSDAEAPPLLAGGTERPAQAHDGDAMAANMTLGGGVAMRTTGSGRSRARLHSPRPQPAQHPVRARGRRWLANRLTP